MAAFQIDTNVPLPSAHKNAAGRTPKYPYRTMLPGDSFFVCSPDRGFNTRLWANSTGYEFTQRTVTENGVKGIRIWRMK